MARVTAVEKPMQYSVLRHVVVHGFGHRDDFHALPVQLRRVAQRIVAADGDYVIQVQRLDVPLDRPCHVRTSWW